MDFDKCYQLLASRPAHAHEECVSEQHEHVHEDLAHLKLAEDSTTPASDAFESFSILGLGREFLSLQERRVQIYRDFNDGFNKLKATAEFQSFCATITARFADVSQQINRIEVSFRTRGRNPLAQVIRKIQEQEKEKLLLTSALLVEKMRVSDQEKRPEPDAGVLALLEKSIATMTAKHTTVIEAINELLDDLRAELADEDDSE